MLVVGFVRRLSQRGDNSVRGQLQRNDGVRVLGAGYYSSTRRVLQENNDHAAQCHACMRDRRHQEMRGGCGQRKGAMFKPRLSYSPSWKEVALTTAGGPAKRGAKN